MFFIWTCFTEFRSNNFGNEFLCGDDNFDKIYKIFSEYKQKLIKHFLFN